MTEDRTRLREPQSAARLSRTFSQSLAAVDIAEPLLSLDENQPASAAVELMRARNLSVLGVRRAGLVAGWVSGNKLAGGTLREQAREFHHGSVFPGNAGFDRVFQALSGTGQVFIEWLGEVAGVITWRDLQKPPLRMWLFGAVTMLDTNLTWAIGAMFPEDSWRTHLSAGRLEKAIALCAERQRRGSVCRLVDCLQIKDKTDILLADSANIAALGLGSRRAAERFARDVEKLRNHLAHAQELESDDLETAGRLASLIPSILSAEGAQRLVAMHLTNTHSDRAAIVTS